MNSKKNKKFLVDKLKIVISNILYYSLRLFPLEDKIVIRSFEGRKFGDNPQFIAEKLLNSNIKIIWLKNLNAHYEVPEGIKLVPDKGIRKFYEYYTAKVWIDTHRINKYLKKRKDQLVIETWHGGLGIKKIDGDVPKFRKVKKLMDEIENMCKIADVFISNSTHLTNVYRSAFGYKGKIWKCGYPKNDILIKGVDGIKEKVKNFYGIDENKKIIVYAPTFRDKNRFKGFDSTLYDIDYEKLCSALSAKTGEEWCVLVKHHPFLINRKKANEIVGDNVVNANGYPDMQELILSADAFISDYSSCIFDAGLRKIPCFTYAKDFEEFKGDRGTYFEMEELPFPYAKNNEELILNIYKFDYNEYLLRWNEFAKKTGLHEDGNASENVAYIIKEFIHGNKNILQKIQSE